MAFDGLLGRLRGLIQEARQHALRAVDVVQVRTCWEVGRHIVEFEQAGADRDEGAPPPPVTTGRLGDNLSQPADAWDSLSGFAACSDSGRTCHQLLTAPGPFW